MSIIEAGAAAKLTMLWVVHDLAFSHVPRQDTHGIFLHVVAKGCEDPALDKHPA